MGSGRGVLLGLHEVGLGWLGLLFRRGCCWAVVMVARESKLPSVVQSIVRGLRVGDTVLARWSSMKYSFLLVMICRRDFNTGYQPPRKWR